MGAFLPQILIVLAIGVIVYLAIKKFAYLSSVDTENLPEEKQAELKMKILEERLKRQAQLWGGKLQKFLSPAGKILQSRVKTWSHDLSQWQHKVKNKQKEILKSNPQHAQLLLRDLLAGGEKLLTEGQYGEAEQMFIEALTLDPRNTEVYDLLGRLYREQKNYPHALATFKHLLNLELKGLELAEKQANGEENQEITVKKQRLAGRYVEVGELYQRQGELEKARETVKQAFKYDENNPKYLDFLCELCIILKDKEEASAALEKLRQINPENAKIEKLSQEIADIQVTA